MSKKAGETTVRVCYTEASPWATAHYLTHFRALVRTARMEFLKELDYSFTEMGREGMGFLIATTPGSASRI